MEKVCRCRKGGFALCWKNEINIQVTLFSQNHIDVIVTESVDI